MRRNAIYLSGAVMNRLLRRTIRCQPAEIGTEETLLSTRELQIFGLIGQGVTTQGIAQQLNLAPSTVETYRERIKTKLNLANGAELTRKAILWTLQNS